MNFACDFPINITMVNTSVTKNYNNTTQYYIIEVIRKKVPSTYLIVHIKNFEGVV